MLHRLWMTKDNTAQVEQFSETAEKGVYVFFDPTTWERVRVIMKYHHQLEEHVD
jgi:CCR4-NOT transcription complex subunit 2